MANYNKSGKIHQNYNILGKILIDNVYKINHNIEKYNKYGKGYNKYGKWKEDKWIKQRKIKKIKKI